jgi:hypothetical protein
MWKRDPNLPIVEVGAVLKEDLIASRGLSHSEFACD